MTVEHIRQNQEVKTELELVLRELCQTAIGGSTF